MKKLIMFTVILVLFAGCTKRQHAEIDFCGKIRLVGKMELNDQISNFVSDFMKSLNNSDCIYELYIDKKTEDEYFLTIFNEPNEPAYLSGRYPVNYTIIENKYVFIYSGLEDFVNKENRESNTTVKVTAASSDRFKARTVSMVILKDTSYVVGEVGLPFTEGRFLPPVEYKVP